MSLLGKYIDELNVDLDKNKLKSMMKTLYVEAQDLEMWCLEWERNIFM